MGRLWRLCRNPYGRAAYDALGRAGITATWMYEYVRSLDAPPRPVTGGADVVAPCDPAAVAALDAPVDELGPDETVVGAFVDGSPVGYLFLSIDARRHVDPLERTLAFDGAYVRRVFVDPERRGEGVATALVSTACSHAAGEGADRATALVALDNVPSRSLFEGRGFEATRSRRYARVGPFSFRSVRRV